MVVRSFFFFFFSKTDGCKHTASISPRHRELRLSAVAPSHSPVSCRHKAGEIEVVFVAALHRERGMDRQNTFGHVVEVQMSLR